MMNAKEIRFSIFTFFLFILISVSSTLCVGDVLFEEDFEGGVIDESKWIPTATWSLDGGVLDVNGGEVGITVRNDFTDFEFSVDFNMVDPLLYGRPTICREFRCACGRPRQLYSGPICVR